MIDESNEFWKRFHAEWGKAKGDDPKQDRADYDKPAWGVMQLYVERVERQAESRVELKENERQFAQLMATGISTEATLLAQVIVHAATKKAIEMMDDGESWKRGGE